MSLWQGGKKRRPRKSWVLKPDCHDYIAELRAELLDREQTYNRLRPHQALNLTAYFWLRLDLFSYRGAPEGKGREKHRVFISSRESGISILFETNCGELAMMTPLSVQIKKLSWVNLNQNF